MSPEPTARPAARSSRPNRTSRLRIVSRSATGCDVREVVADELEVIALLHDRAQCVAGGRLSEVGLAQEVQGPRPVDRLGDAWGLGEVEFAKPVHGRDHLARERLTDAGFL